MLTSSEPIEAPAPGSRLLTIVAALAIPLALASLVFLLAAQAHFAAALRREVETSLDRQLKLERLLSLHSDIETAARGYALSGQSEFLKPYNRADPRIDPTMTALDRLDGEAPGHSRLDALRGLSQAKRAFMRQVIASRNDGTLAQITWSEGKRRMDAVRAEIARLQQAEALHLADLSRRSDAAQQEIRLSAIAILGVLSVLLAIIGFVMVRTMRERTRALAIVADQARRRRALLNATMDGIFILNPNGEIESVNRSGARMFGYGEAELAGHDGGAFLSNALQPGRVAAHLRRMRLKEGDFGVLRQVSARCRDGSILPIEVALSALTLADGIHYVAIVRDLSERRRIERMKAEFIASIGQELRSPLSSTAATLALLASGGGGPLPDQAARLVAIAAGGTDRLMRLIDTLLDIDLPNLPDAPPE